MSSTSMIEVEELTKRYNGHTAVAGVSFSVNKGEIVGLLGQNGAGKSTIMRILSCFLPASAGTVKVAGHNVFTEPDEVRRRIGYMPENNPLHRDMRVKEYLRFRAQLKGLGSSRMRERVDTVMQQCDLTNVQRKLIGHLSKGYQQRVGLADALVHEPDLIILDEPTIGLDPNQIRSVRKLIKDLGGHHTVLISSHILPEVEMTCSRVLILNQGKILADDTPENLQARLSKGGQVVAEIATDREALEDFCEQCPEVEDYDLSPLDGAYWRCAMTSRPGVDLRPLVFQTASERKWELRELTRSRHSLEDIFVAVTRAPREEDAY